MVVAYVARQTFQTFEVKGAYLWMFSLSRMALVKVNTRRAEARVETQCRFL